VRVYNASNAEISATVGNTNLNEVAPLGSTAFSFMPQGDYTAKLGSQSLPVKLAGDHYYTIVNNAQDSLWELDAVNTTSPKPINQ
jgi:alginate O-acetyltransferase complex protein AlgF